MSGRRRSRGGIQVIHVLRAWEDVEGKGQCHWNVIVPEMLKALPMEFAHEVARWFQKRFQGQCSAPEARKMLRLAFLQKPNAKRETWIKGHRAIAQMSVFETWYAAAVVPLLQEEDDPMECDKSHGWRRKRSEQ